ncbi:lysophospholipid acyltransferase family protein [Bernardetia sp.]|uniref:lysophospholipid acyltransferase family protein n=1 Tax=Bernardetia sp. TaxID=1937974 RepID=UPI0025B984A5|nr:lysophospholipid acyltransferase family protein [Bernardetia sp.]
MMIQEKLYELRDAFLLYAKDRGLMILMRPFTTLFQIAFSMWTFFNFFWIMVVCAPFIIFPILMGEKRGGRFAFTIMKIWGFSFSLLSGIIYRIKNKKTLQKGQPYIFIANHNSFLDSPAITLAIPNQFRALGKIEILKMPVFGLIFKYIGVVVDRSSMQSKKRSLRLIKEKLKKQIHVMIFPEGTMNNSDFDMLRFHDGAFLVAIETQTPIAPLVIKNTRRMLPKNSWRVKAGFIEVEFLEPISTEGMTIQDLPALKMQAYQMMQTAYSK